MDNSTSLWMAVKVLGIAALGIAFVWWQFRDLAREKKRSEARRLSSAAPENPPS
jgi:Flp pilus assembly protein TadB